MRVYESEYGDSPNNFHVTKSGAELRVELTYPPYTDGENTRGQCRYVYVNQESVRASDGIRMFYDFERDGWVIQQPKYDDESGEEDWAEAAFVRSWAREAPPPNDSGRAA